jgi:hypothetical protein
MALTNAPESEALTLDDITLFENGRQQVNVLRRTFDSWAIIGRCVVRAREIADRRRGGKTFMRLLDQQGITPALGRSPKTMASKLEKIMKHYAAVVAWRETLTTHQQIDWSAPSTVLARCPVFAKPERDPNEPKPLTKAEQDRMALAAALEENAKLKQREDGDRFKPTDTVKDIATVLVGMFSSSKAKAIAGEMLNMIKDRAMSKATT